MDVKEKRNSAKGLWADNNVPKSGWVCIAISDLGPDPNVRAICEMCTEASIRYVHHLKHYSYPNELETGCMCAGRLEGNVDIAKSRERELVNYNKRKNNWLYVRKWRTSLKGNLTTSIYGSRITVYKYGDKYKFVIEGNHSAPFDTVHAAKLGCFEYLNPR